MAKMRNGGEALHRREPHPRAAPGNRRCVHGEVRRAHAAVKVGRGTEDGVGLGAMDDQDQLDKIAELVDDAVSKARKVACGGERLEGPGHFYAATVLTDVPDDARLLTEEIFGPVAPIRVFDSEDEAVAEANATEYGPHRLPLHPGSRARAPRRERARDGHGGPQPWRDLLGRCAVRRREALRLWPRGRRRGIEEYVETKYISMPF